MKKFPLRFILIILILIIISIGATISKDYKLPHFQGKTYTQDNWVLSVDELGYSENVKLPMALDYKGDYKYSLSTTITFIPDDFENPYAFFDMNHMYFKVFLDNKEIYSYWEDETPHFSKSPGNSYAMVPLSSDCYGKDFRIDFRPTLESGIVYTVDDVLFGDYSTVLHDTFNDNYIHDILVICILFTGIVLVIFSGVILQSKDSLNSWYIGLFAIFFGTYHLTENLFNLYMVSNPYITYLINFIVFAAIPIPIVLFFKDKVLPSFSKYYSALTALLCFNVAIQCCLHFFGIMDIRQLLKYTHILLLISVILVGVSLYKTPKNYYMDRRNLIISILPIFIGLIIDAFFHYFLIYAVKKSNTFYLLVGVLFFLVMQGIQVLKSILVTYKTNIESEIYKTLAFEDGLTSLNNRAAYNAEIQKIKEHKNDINRLICICVDINNLKKINDTFGHQAGDEVICKTAIFLKKYFSRYGKVFRIGGDEFAVFIYALDEERLQTEIHNLYDELRKYNLTAPVYLQFALGYEIYDKNEDIESCLRRADKNMYAEKLRLKSLEK